MPGFMSITVGTLGVFEAPRVCWLAGGPFLKEVITEVVLVQGREARTRLSSFRAVVS